MRHAYTPELAHTTELIICDLNFFECFSFDCGSSVLIIDSLALSYMNRAAKAKAACSPCCRILYGIGLGAGAGA